MLNQNNMGVHLDKVQFKAAIEFTAAKTGFQPELIEKDYICSLILNDFDRHLQDILIFKGGTLLAKVYAGFYRLSEDLDFTISVASSATRQERRRLVSSIKPFVHSLSNRLSNISIEKELTGSDESRQYHSEMTYASCLAEKRGRVLIEIGLREEIQCSISKEKMNTLLLNPFTQKQYMTPFYFFCLNKQEAYAEKMRAALTRTKMAIRDFYDLDYAIKNKILNLEDPNFISILKIKLAIPNATLIEFDNDKIIFLKNKIVTELMPTLNQSQKMSFDLDKIITVLNSFTKKHLIS
jgi:predicted nucleotidyltransferase component of viral defense system